MKTEAVQLELFTNRFTGIACEMGAILLRSALSTNIKERQDFSCALLDDAGRLVVNAPHIPVHLGALGVCVRKVLQTIKLAPGDSIVTNHPGFGGSHLPDVTVITPVFNPTAPERLLALVANRGHHAEIGGTHPGSMPPNARTLAEEGIVIPPTYLVKAGTPRWEDIRHLLAGGRHPSRTVDDNLADLAAAVAANHRGVLSLTRLAVEHSAETVTHFMAALRAQACRRMEEALARLPKRAMEAEEFLDDGSRLAVKIEVREGRAIVDFAGSSKTHPGNLNATPAIVKSAVIYVLRLLISESLPLNEGILDPVEIRIPDGMLNPDFSGTPESSPAVVGGNVETSQRLVDTMLKALELAACSQGTMNNVIFGTSEYGYYETVAGGCGAGPTSAGASAVHSHMTNTRITDPEILEHRYPVRLEQFAIRQGSGGLGERRGGDGVVREIRFLKPATLSILSQHRTVAPYGLAGGEDGTPGRQRVAKPDGEWRMLESVDGCEVATGDRLILETPGGGGWGKANEDKS
ncbi:MAG: hydantoinase B/oxoprolinase family protein [bacterium]|nr:hydantoinase B/oxoprolinase family protein [bacterium]